MGTLGFLALLLRALVSPEIRSVLIELLPVIANIVQLIRQHQLDKQETQRVMNEISQIFNEAADRAITARAAARLDPAGVLDDPNNLGTGPGES